MKPFTPLDAMRERAERAERELAALKAELSAQSAAARTEYEKRNPLGGPATMFDAIAERIRAGEEYHSVLADYDLCVRSSAPVASKAREELELIRSVLYGFPAGLARNDALRAVHALLDSSAAPAAPVALEGNCPQCKGSGESKGMTYGHGPDDYEIDIPCPNCNGTGTVSATPATVKAALVAARGDILQAWADRCGIDVTDERVQEANKVGWPHDYGLFEAGWNALARALISRADSGSDKGAP